MSDRRFIDTNVLAYVFDNQSPAKSVRAKQILREGSFVISSQVLGELYVTLTRKLTVKVPAQVAADAINELRLNEVVPITAALVSAAVQTSVKSQLSYWDALIVESSAAAKCTILLSEDLSDGQVIQGVRVVNPFKQPLTF